MSFRPQIVSEIFACPQFMRQSAARWFVVASLLLAGLTAPLAAQETDDEKAFKIELVRGKRYALLIACEGYKKATPLVYTNRDVQQLAITLRERGGYGVDEIVEMTDQASGPYVPNKENMERVLQEFLAIPGPDDSILVYFSGHGFRDKQERMYLAPVDCDPADAVQTGISIQWFREQLAGSKAGLKFLILDCCHAGAQKAVGGKEPDEDLWVQPFKDLKVLTMASSTADQRSLIWEEKKQSLFSYWMVQGLKGSGDIDGDGQVDFDELYKYVERNVNSTAERFFAPREQSPVRIIRSEVIGVPVVLELQPVSLDQALADIGEQITVKMEEHNLDTVAVLEFTNSTATGELLGSGFGTLGRWCANKLDLDLKELRGADATVSQRQLRGILNDQAVGVDDLGSTRSLASLSGSLEEEVGGKTGIVVGMLQNRRGRVITFRCELIDVVERDGKRRQRNATFASSAVLTENDWAHLGLSGDFRQVSQRVEQRVQEQVLADAANPNSTNPNRPADPNANPSANPNANPSTNPTQTARPSKPRDLRQQVVEAKIDEYDQISRQAHPLADPQFPYRVRILKQLSQGRSAPVEGYFKNNASTNGQDYVVQFEKGDVFSIEVSNDSGQPVMMRLLVDGLNTLPQKDPDNPKVLSAVRQRVHMSEARAWVLDPRNTRNPVWEIGGFVTETGDTGELYQFTIVDAADSVAARSQFTDQIGLITAAFYTVKASERGPQLGVGQGVKRSEVIPERRGVEPGELLGVVHIRYEGK